MRRTRTHKRTQNGCSSGKSVFWINHFEKWLLLSWALLSLRLTFHKHAKVAERSEIMEVAKCEQWTVNDISLLLAMTANERASDCDKNPMKLRQQYISIIHRTHLQTKRTIYILYSNICSLRSWHLSTHHTHHHGKRQAKKEQQKKTF